MAENFRKKIACHLSCRGVIENPNRV